MLSEVKKCANNNDIKGLRYIFVDCLDVDPTFEKYSEDYEYCKSIRGFLEPYKELTPLHAQRSNWNKNYYNQLKLDLMKNFSEKRFEHMVEVAKVIYADKIARLQQERKRKNTTISNQDINNSPIHATSSNNNSNKANVKISVENEERIKAAKEKLARENKIAEEKQREQQELLKQKRQQQQNIYANNSGHKSSSSEDSSKKAMGIVLLGVLIILIIIVIIIVAVLNQNQ